MSYDAAGNLTTDTYTGFGNRVYDAENKMTAAQDNAGVWAYYTYNADGQRTRRKINNQETWQYTALTESCWLNIQRTAPRANRRKSMATEMASY